MGTFEDLINQIDAFIRKFYKNLMIKGVFLFLIVFLFSFLLVTGLEFLGRFNSFIRGVLLFSFIGVNGYILTRYFIIPLTKLLSLGKRINRFQAATIIGNFFPSIDDRLLNTLQLHNATTDHPKNLDFVMASIEQNSKQLNTFTFTTAIDYSKNRKFFKYVVPILLTVVLVGFLAPDLFSVGSERLIKYNQVFEKAPDFEFELQNEILRVEEGKDITIAVKLKPMAGKAIPERVYIESSEGNFLMKKISNTQASYTFNNVNNNVDFFFKAQNSNSKEFAIEVVKRSSLGHLKVSLSYPKYMGRSDETIDNPGDLILPNGTAVTWDGVTKNTKKLSVYLEDTIQQFKESGFRLKHKVNRSTDVLFILENNNIDKKDTVLYHIDVIKDEYPGISLSRLEDSLIKNKIYFTGDVNDDYGISQLQFTYIIERESKDKTTKTINVPGISGKQSPFSMTFNLGELGLSLEDKVTYFFTVFDNDGVNGPKATKSSVYTYKSPSLEELKETRSEDKNKATDELKDLIRESKEFKEEVARLKKEMANSKNTSWQQQQQMKDLNEQQKSLQQRIQETKEQLKSSFEEKNKLSPADEKLMEKQKALEDMLDELMDDELRDLLEELQKMMDANRNEDVLEMLENTEMSAEDMERQLDRTMEMLKKMDVEERVDDLQKSLEKLSDEQDKLKEDLDKGMSKEEASKKQEELNEKFDTLKEDLKEMLEKNEELKRPMYFDGMEELMEEISDDMQDAGENIDKGKNEDAQEKQEGASEKMEQAAAQLQAQMQSSQQQQQEEDYAALRALLENLMRLSFSQEQNMEAFKESNVYDPYFVTLGQEQRGIMDNFKPVKDSLRALAERIPETSSFIEQEISTIDKNYKYIPTHIGERESRRLGVKQQFVMTSYNNLALFLNEAMESAQQQMGAGAGGGSCDTPGGEGEGKSGKGSSGKGKPGGSGEGDMEGLKEMIKKQLEQMKGGQGSPGQNPGSQNPGGILPMNSQQAAKMAAEQSAIQQKLQELREQLNKNGTGEGNQLNDLLNELEKQQEDLINKKWDTQLIDRQQDILTRLLESENAMRERGWDEKRESDSGKDEHYGNQIEFLEYKKQKEKQIELLRTLDPSFSRYYKEKANAYFQNIN